MGYANGVPHPGWSQPQVKSKKTWRTVLITVVCVFAAAAIVVFSIGQLMGPGRAPADTPNPVYTPQPSRVPTPAPSSSDTEPAPQRPSPSFNPTALPVTVPDVTASAEIGQKVRLVQEGVDVSVTSAGFLQDTVGGFIVAAPGKTFLVVPLRVENPNSSQTSLILGDQFWCRCGKTWITVHVAASMFYGLDTGELNPLAAAILESGEPLDGVVVFEVPDNQVSGSELIISNRDGTATAISTGL
jgi:hypothetical protein